MPTLLCYGDSNTHGTVPLPAGRARQRYGRDIRWPGLLAAALGPDWHVIEEGLPGRSTVHDDPLANENRNGLALLPAILASHRPVDLVVLMLGTNDLKERFAATPADIARGVEMCARAVLHDAWGEGFGPEGAAPALLVVAPPPLVERGDFATGEAGSNAKSRALASLLNEVADALSAHFLDAGAHAGFSPIDGVHLDEEGHRDLARAVADSVSRITPL